MGLIATTGWRPCPNRGTTANDLTRWVVNNGPGRPRTCAVCGSVLEKGDVGLFLHPQEGLVPDYGQPEPIPVGVRLVKYDGMECDCGRIFLGAFYPDGRLVGAREVFGKYHRNGRWSYNDLSVVVPEECVLLCVTRSTHASANQRRYLKYRDREAFIGKLTELDRLPDAARISQQLGVEISPEVLEHIVLYRTLFATRLHWQELVELADIPSF